MSGLFAHSSTLSRLGFRAPKVIPRMAFRKKLSSGLAVQKSQVSVTSEALGSSRGFCVMQ